MTSPSRLGPDALDQVLESLFSTFPTAPIAAFSPSALICPMPASVPIGQHRVIQGSVSTLNLVAAEDVNTVIDTWTRARQHGSAFATVRLASNPERQISVHYVDAMHSHGVYIGLFATEGTDALMAGVEEAATFRPKVALIQKNELAFIRQIDEATTQILGWQPAEMIGRRSLEFIHPEDHEAAIAHWMDMLRSPGSRRRVRVRHRHRDGSWVWFEVTNQNLLGDPDHGYVVTELVDITSEMAAHESLRAREHLLRRLTEALPLGVLQVDSSGRIVYRNARLASILGHADAVTVDQQLASVVAGQRRELKAALNAVLLEGCDRDLEIAVRPRSGELLHRCTISLRALTDDAGEVTGAIAAVADVTESVRMREELEDRATFDVLTRCRNRASILLVLEQSLAGSRRGGGTGAIFVDLDHFKQVNDRLGHAAGDVLLVEVAHCLCRQVRGADVVGRLGGDEFLVVCGRIESAAQALEIAERIADALGALEVELGAETVTPRASIGVVWTPASARVGADALVARADAAMYESKRQRHGRPVLFPAELPATARRTTRHRRAA